MRRTTLGTQSRFFEWFSIQLLVNSEIFKLSLNLSLAHLEAQSACYELKGDFSPVILRKYFTTVWKFRNLQGFGKPFKRNWVEKVVFPVQIFLIFGRRCNRYFWDIRLKIRSLPNALSAHVNIFFSKANCFRVYRKLITWSTNAKAYWGNTIHWNACHRQKLANSLKIFNGDPLQDMEFWHRVYCNHNYNKIL